MSEQPGNKTSDFERRLAKLRQPIARNILDGFKQPSLVEPNSGHDDDVASDGSGETTYSVNTISSRFNTVQNDCCKVGELLASLGFNCKDVRFSAADRRRKVVLINTTFRNIGVEFTDQTRVTVFLPFRKCVLQQPRNIDKCCLVSRGEHSSAYLDIGSNRLRHRQIAGFDGRRVDNGCVGGKFGNCKYVDMRSSKRKASSGRRVGQRARRYHGSRLSQRNFNQNKWSSYLSRKRY